MQSPSASVSKIALEVGRIRELSKSGMHSEALVAAEQLLKEAPQNRDVLYLLAANQRCLNQIDTALATLQRLEQEHPRFSLLHQERGYCYTTLRDGVRAVAAFERAVDINPALLASWSMLDRLYGMKRDAKNAAVSAEHIARLKNLAPEVVRAGSLFSDGDLSAAENILRPYLLQAGDDTEALRLMARIKQKYEVLDEAESLLGAALKLAPNYLAARIDLAHVLIDAQKYLGAREECDALLKIDPGNTDYRSLYAAACSGLGEHEAAIHIYRDLLVVTPDSTDLQVLLGHSLKAIGQQKEATERYQSAAAIKPSFGDAWWSLANLKTHRFSDNDIAQMRAQEAAPSTHPIDRYHLCFALGKALEDREEFAESWNFYERGNALKRAESRYQAEITEASMREQIEVCSAQFFAARVGLGAPESDPIFIVGLPRSGSTLVEQILASHSHVEGTQELAEIQRIAQSLGRISDSAYPRALAELTPEDFRTLGERYLTETRVYRKHPHKPFFVDKMPNNFRHIGLIHLMLPNAKIIDVRREPMACCFSNLKQLFAGGQEFSYGSEDMARYYRSYVNLMHHWNTVLPNRVLRVGYEDVVADLAGNVHRILEFCGLGFESSCLQFYKTQRTVRTPSSEQVRQPIFREGLRQWKNYEPWLGPLQKDLGADLFVINKS